MANYPGGAASAPLTLTFTTLRGTAVRGTLAGTPVQLFPKPAQRSTPLVLPALGTARTARLVLANALGQTVRTQTLTLTPSGTRALVDLTGLATGRYTVRVQAGTEAAVLPLVVE